MVRGKEIRGYKEENSDRDEEKERKMDRCDRRCAGEVRDVPVSGRIGSTKGAKGRMGMWIRERARTVKLGIVEEHFVASSESAMWIYDLSGFAVAQIRRI